MKMSKLHHVKRSFLSLLFISFLSTTTINVILTNFQVGASASPNGTVMAVDPPLSTANPNEYFTINFTIANVTNLYSWQLKLKWQPAPLLDIDGSNITEGPFLKQGGNTIFPKSAFRDHIDVACNLAGTPPGTPWNPITPQNGSGLLASATFKVTDTGNSTLELYETHLIGWNYTSGTTYEINHTTVNGTFYTTYPVAKFTYTPSPQEYPGHPIVGETVTFNASVSYDPDQFYKGQAGTGIVSCEWDFGDDTYSSGMITTHVYDEAGVYYVTLNVTDDDVEKYSETYPPEGLNIQFHDIAVINVTVTPTEVSPGGTVTINATVLNKGSAKEFMNVTAYCNLYPVNTTIFTYLKWIGYNWVPTQYLLKGENATTSITWNVGEIPAGNYTISVETFIVTQTTPHVAIPGIEREENLYDNGMIGGTLTITGEEKHDLAVTNIVVDPTDLELLEFSDIRLSIQNKGTVDEQFNATLTIYKDSSIFKTRLLKGGNGTVKAGETKPLEWTAWLRATATMDEGLYNITASVSIVNATTLEEIQDNAGQGMLDNVDSIPVNMRIFPKAHFTYSPTEPFVDEAVTFNATASYAPGATQGTIKYTWDFGDGVSKKDQTSPVIFHVYTSNGTFTVTLNVAEGGLATSVTHDVTINPFHNLAITNVALSPNVVTSGEAMSINVTIKNTGYFEENFNVITYYYENEIVTQTNITLMADAETTLTFTWDTTGVAGGNYMIKAVVTSAAEETETTDNTRIGGTATITKLTSSITLSASSTTMTIGGSTTFTGSITPTRSGANVTIWIRKNGEEWSEHDTVTTDGNGDFSYSWTPPSAGSYGVKVRWLGDDVTQSDESDVQIVKVKEALTSNVFLYTTIAFALLSVAIVAYFIWVRKTKPT